MSSIKNIMLLMDVVCSECGKLIALSTAYTYQNKYMCGVCADVIIKEIDKLYGLEFDN